MDEGVFLDTNVYIGLTNGLWPDLISACREAGLTIYLCPSTILEAFEDFWNCSPPNLERHRAVLKLMLEHGGKKILPPEALGEASKHNGALQASHLQAGLRFAVRLSVSEWKSGVAGSKVWSRSIFQDQMDAYRNSYLNGMESFRAEMLSKGPFAKGDLKQIRRYFETDPRWGTTYFSKLLRAVGLRPLRARIERCKKILAAKFAFETEHVILTAVGKYKPLQHRGDCFDGGHLRHLCDKRLSFVTNDRKIYDRTRRSVQAERILNPCI